MTRVSFAFGYDFWVMYLLVYDTWEQLDIRDEAESSSFRSQLVNVWLGNPPQNTPFIIGTQNHRRSNYGAVQSPSMGDLRR